MVQAAPDPTGRHRSPGGGMTAHQISTLAVVEDGTHVAVCLCGWRSEPLRTGDDAAATGLMHQLRML